MFRSFRGAVAGCVAVAVCWATSVAAAGPPADADPSTDEQPPAATSARDASVTRAEALSAALGSPDVVELARTLVDRVTATVRVERDSVPSQRPRVERYDFRVDVTADDALTRNPEGFVVIEPPDGTWDFTYVTPLRGEFDDASGPAFLEPSTLEELLPESRLRLLEPPEPATPDTVAVGANGWHCPVHGYSFGDTWGAPRSGGRTHEGTDIVAPIGAPLRAAAPGVVVRSNTVDRPGSLGGITLSIADGAGNHAYYAHLHRIAPGVGIGTYVQAGDIIGVVGDTGNARWSVPHLHFGWYVHGVAVNPFGALRDACRGTGREPLAP